MTSRRKFLKSGTMVAVAAGIPGGLSKAIEVTARDLSLSSSFTLTKAAFAANLNSRFMIRAEGFPSTAVKLAKIEDLKRYNRGEIPAANREGFSLMFEGPRGLAQNNYQFEHEKMGKFDLLMVPVQGSKKRGQSYEVIINRLFA